MLRLEVLALVPTIYKQCAHCETMLDESGIGEKVHEENSQEYPADVLEDHARLSAWIAELVRQYGNRIEIRLIDPQSGVGLWKALRHRVRQYPTFIIDGQETYAGWDKGRLEDILQRALNT